MLNICDKYLIGIRADIRGAQEGPMFGPGSVTRFIQNRWESFISGGVGWLPICCHATKNALHISKFESNISLNVFGLADPVCRAQNAPQKPLVRSGQVGL